METSNLSVGSYSISSDGMSINYSAPSFLPIETIKNVMIEKIELDKSEEPGTSFNDILSAIIKVPKQ